MAQIVLDGQEDFSGGMMPARRITNIPENGCVSMRNLQLYGDGYIGWRKGREKEFDYSFAEANKPVAITGLHNYKYGTTKELLICAGTKIFSYNYTTNTITELKSGQTADLKWNTCEFYNYVILMQNKSSIAAAGMAPLKYDGTNITTLGGVAGNYQFAEEYQNYLFAADGDEFLDMSDIGNPESWNNTFTIGESKYDPIMGLKKFLGALWIFTTRKISIIDGYGNASFRNFQHSTSVGTVSHATIQVVKDKLLWLDQDGFWYSDGGLPKKASIDISPLLRTIDQNYIKQSWSAVYRESGHGFTNYYCWIPIGESGTVTANNACVVYNWDTNSWRVYDFFAGEVACAAEDEYGNEMLYAGDDKGRLYRMEHGRTDDGLVIPGEFISRGFHFQYPEYEKTLSNVYIWYRARTDTTIKVQISSDFGGKAYPPTGYMTKELTGDGDVPVLYEFNALADRDHYLRGQRARILKVTGLALTGRFFQIRLANAELGNEVYIYRILLEANMGGIQA